MELKEIAEITESFAIILAVVVGGAWTLFTFKALRLRNKAEKELLELEQKLSFEARLKIDIEYNYRKIDGLIILSVDVIIENIGNRNTAIYYPDKKPLSIKKVEFENDNSGSELIELGIPKDKYITQFAKGAILHPQERIILPFICSIENVGVYYIVFSATPTINIEDSAKSLELTEKDIESISWTSGKYAVVT